MKLLCASDLHLGRRAPGIPEHLGLDSARFATAHVWDHIVEIAIAERVDAVLIPGDIIDRENRTFEALGPLEQGVQTLDQHGIPAYGIAGEQDFDILRRAADSGSLRNLSLLGLVGDWERVTVERDGQPLLTVIGVSSIGQTARANPLAGVDDVLKAHEPQPVVALLHGSVTGTDHRDVSPRFSPVAAGELSKRPVALWIAGHEHRPFFDADSRLLQPGAVCPIWTHDTGQHGVFLVELGDEPESEPRARFIPTSPVRYATLSIDLAGARDEEHVDQAVIGAVRDALTAAIKDDPQGNLRCLCCHLAVTGRTPLHSEIPALIKDLTRTLDVHERGVIAAVTDTAIETTPDIDLAPLLRRPDPVGEAARLIDALDEPDADKRSPAQRELIQRTTTRLQAVHRARVFTAVAGDDEPDETEAVRLLRRQGWDLVDALIKQRGVE
jgi:DNA repair exonuclease SbcCD nuclease subunit